MDSEKTVPVQPIDLYPIDFVELIHLSYAERLRRFAKNWEVFRSYGGTLEPDPDPQSPFFDPKISPESFVDGRSGVHIVRRGGV